MILHQCEALWQHMIGFGSCIQVDCYRHSNVHVHACTYARHHIDDHFMVNLAELYSAQSAYAFHDQCGLLINGDINLTSNKNSNVIMSIYKRRDTVLYTHILSNCTSH